MKTLAYLSGYAWMRLCWALRRGTRRVELADGSSVKVRVWRWRDLLRVIELNQTGQVLRISRLSVVARDLPKVETLDNPDFVRIVEAAASLNFTPAWAAAFQQSVRRAVACGWSR